MSKLQSLRVCVLSHVADSWLDGLQGSGHMDEFGSGWKRSQKKSNDIDYQTMLGWVALFLNLGIRPGSLILISNRPTPYPTQVPGSWRKWTWSAKSELAFNLGREMGRGHLAKSSCWALPWATNSQRRVKNGWKIKQCVCVGGIRLWR